MNLRKTSFHLAILGMLVAAGTGCHSSADQPTLHLASQAEIDAVLPKELVAAPAIDKLAQARYSRLSQLLDRMSGPSHDKKRLSNLGLKSGRLMFPPGRATEADRANVLTPGMIFWKANRSTLRSINELLESGPIQPEADLFSNRAAMLQSLQIVKLGQVAWLCAEALYDRKDFDLGTEMIELAISLACRLLEGCSDNGSYLESELLFGIASEPVKRAGKNPDLPLAYCERLLKRLPVATTSDEPLARVLQGDFQRIGRIQLATKPIAVFRGAVQSAQNPTPYFRPEIAKFDYETLPIAGTYDGVETARMCGARIMAEIANARRAWADFDNSSLKVALANVRNLPTAPAKGTDAQKLDEYRHRMNTEPNTIGRVICVGMTDFKAIHAISLQFRTEQNAIRVLLASAIYRRAHGGALPQSIDGFLPILGKWPVDPYTGKGMIYRPKEQKVYSVGENLKDDGGDFSLEGMHPKDQGLSLNPSAR